MEELMTFDRTNSIRRLAEELPEIRKELSLSCADLERMTNIGAKRITAIEEGRQELKWSEYLSILFVQWANEGSRGLLEDKKLFPIELKRAFSVNRNAHE